MNTMRLFMVDGSVRLIEADEVRRSGEFLEFVKRVPLRDTTGRVDLATFSPHAMLIEGDGDPVSATRTGEDA